MNYFAEDRARSSHLRGNIVAFDLVDKVFTRAFFDDVSWTGVVKKSCRKKDCFSQFSRIRKFFFRLCHSVDKNYTMPMCDDWLKNVAIRTSGARMQVKGTRASRTKNRKRSGRRIAQHSDDDGGEHDEEESKMDEEESKMDEDESQMEDEESKKGEEESKTDDEKSKVYDSKTIPTCSTNNDDLDLLLSPIFAQPIASFIENVSLSTPLTDADTTNLQSQAPVNAAASLLNSDSEEVVANTQENLALNSRSENESDSDEDSDIDDQRGLLKKQLMVGRLINQFVRRKKNANVATKAARKWNESDREVTDKDDI